MARGRPSRRAQIDSSKGHSTSPSPTSSVRRRSGIRPVPRTGRRHRGSTVAAPGRPPRPAHPSVPGSWPGSAWSGRARAGPGRAAPRTSMRCSQLSSTTSVLRPQRNSTMRARSLFGSPLIGRPSAAAIADAIPSPSVTSASSTSHTSISSASRISRAASIASRVFPTPPGPTSVTSRRRRNRAASASSRSRRPTSEVSGVRSLARRGDGGGSGSRRTVVSSWRRIAVSSARSSGDGSSPTSSARTLRADSYARSASVWRPDRDSASIS